MRFLNSNILQTHVREDENRSVKVYVDEALSDADWITITSSRKENEGTVRVLDHVHPNALEIIVFLRYGMLEIDSVTHEFSPGEAVMIEPGEKHSAHNLKEHDCICILLGKGKPQKKPVI